MADYTKESSDAVRWLSISFIVAVSFALFLVNVDHTLSTSDSEHRKGQEMHEVRLAQTSLGSGSVDRREVSPFVASGETKADHNH
ncbi:MAG: hypothetical protein H6619_02485 [Deltaproteobacteria bacterium]|nr:hypothetical protein [Deltaproteobacteria bacterium]